MNATLAGSRIPGPLIVRTNRGLSPDTSHRVTFCFPALEQTSNPSGDMAKAMGVVTSAAGTSTALVLPSKRAMPPLPLHQQCSRSSNARPHGVKPGCSTNTLAAPPSSGNRRTRASANSVVNTAPSRTAICVIQPFGLPVATVALKEPVWPS